LIDRPPKVREALLHIPSVEPLEAFEKALCQVEIADLVASCTRFTPMSGSCRLAS
jgi:hypothetical protein